MKVKFLLKKAKLFHHFDKIFPEEMDQSARLVGVSICWDVESSFTAISDQHFC